MIGRKEENDRKEERVGIYWLVGETELRRKRRVANTATMESVTAQLLSLFIPFLILF